MAYQPAGEAAVKTDRPVSDACFPTAGWREIGNLKYPISHLDTEDMVKLSQSFMPYYLAEMCSLWSGQMPLYPLRDTRLSLMYLEAEETASLFILHLPVKENARESLIPYHRDSRKPSSPLDIYPSARLDQFQGELEALLRPAQTETGIPNPIQSGIVLKHRG
jgi:hypothetical protein